MQRGEFEHVIADGANVTGESEFVVIGSQAVIGLHGDRVPPTLLNSMEVDIYPLRDPAKADAIDAHRIAMNDLVLSKCVAGRERDWEYAETSLEMGLVDINTLLGLVPTLPARPDIHAQISAMLRGISARLTAPS